MLYNISDIFLYNVDFVNLMNINFNNMNSRYLILFFMVSVFSVIVFLASYKDTESVFANPPITKDQMNNMMGTQNQNMMTDPRKINTMMKQMNNTGMMMGGQQWPMMGSMMMGTGQGMTMPCMMMAPMMMGNQTMMSMIPCMMMAPMMMGGQQPSIMDRKHHHMMVEGGQQQESSKSNFSMPRNNQITADGDNTIYTSIVLGAASRTTDAFQPNPIYLKEDQMVVWTNNDRNLHTVTQRPLSEGIDTALRFDSGMLSRGQSFSYIFGKAGTYNYYCTIHPWMIGKRSY